MKPANMLVRKDFDGLPDIGDGGDEQKSDEMLSPEENMLGAGQRTIVHGGKISLDMELDRDTLNDRETPIDSFIQEPA